MSDKTATVSKLWTEKILLILETWFGVDAAGESVACTEAADPKLVTFKRRGGDYIRMLSEAVGRERTQLELVQKSRRRKEKKLSILHFCHFWSEHSSITNRLGNPVCGLLTAFSPIPIFIAWFLLVPFITLFFFLLLSFNHKRVRLSQHALCFSAAWCWRNVSDYEHNKRLPQVSIHLNKHLKMRRIQLKKKKKKVFLLLEKLIHKLWSAAPSALTVHILVGGKLQCIVGQYTGDEKNQHTRGVVAGCCGNKTCHGAE